MLRELIDHLNPFFHNKPVRTSGFVFKCLTCFTVNVLVASVFMISLKQYFGLVEQKLCRDFLYISVFSLNREPIKCISSSKDYTSYMETKCWIEGVFLDHNIFNYTVDEAIAVGVGSPRFIDSGGRIHKTLVYQNYYQWVAPVLALEAILLFLPRLLWRSLENGVMEKLLRSAGKWIHKKCSFLEVIISFNRFSYHDWWLEQPSRNDLEVLQNQKAIPPHLRHQISLLWNFRIVNAGKHRKQTMETIIFIYFSGLKHAHYAVDLQQLLDWIQSSNQLSSATGSRQLHKVLRSALSSSS